MTDRIDTEALRRAHEATTQGEWTICIYDCGDTPHRNANGPCPSIQCESADCGIVHWDGFKQEYWTSANGNQKEIEANARFIALAHREVPALCDEIDRLRAELRKANGANWYYLGDECSSDHCRSSIDECIDEDFLHYNRAEGNHVVLISGARPVPDMWLALKFFTEEEKDERGDDEPYTFTIHESEEAARTALEKEPS